MNVHISYKVQKTPDIEKEINHLIEKLRKRLQGVETVFRTLQEGSVVPDHPDDE